MGRFLQRLKAAASGPQNVREELVTVVSYNDASKTYRVNLRGVEVEVPGLGGIIAQAGSTARLVLHGNIPNAVIPL